MARHFKNWLRAYMDYTRDSESPSAFHFWTGVSTVAGALRRRVWVDMRKFTWTPNFYVILVAPPGITAKTTSVGMGYHILSKVPGIHFGPESLTWQALADSLAAATEGVKYLDADGKESHIAQSAISVFIGELGTFLSLDDDKFISVLIRMWEGQVGNFRHKTKTQGEVDILNPWLNLIGCTTPDWMTRTFHEGMIGGGLVSRCIFIFGDKKRQLIPYPDEVIQASEYYDLEKKLTEDLKEIARLSGPYLLSPSARVWGRNWYNRHWTSRPAHMASDRYGGYIARKQTHIHKLAIIIAAAQSDKLIIEAENLQEAEACISSVEPDMIRVFESIGMAPESGQIREVVAIVQTNGWMTSDDLWKQCMSTMPQRYFEEALKGAVRAGLLIVQTQNGTKGVICPPHVSTSPSSTTHSAQILPLHGGKSTNYS